MAGCGRPKKAWTFRAKAPNPRNTLVFSEDLHHPDRLGSKCFWVAEGDTLHRVIQRSPTAVYEVLPPGSVCAYFDFDAKPTEVAKLDLALLSSSPSCQGISHWKRRETAGCG